MSPSLGDSVAVMSDISDLQILQTLEEKAKLFTKMAADFRKAMGPAGRTVTEAASSNRLLPITISHIRDYLSNKGGRPGDLAKHLGCTPDDILALVNQPNSGVEVVARGWLKLKKPE